MKIKIAKFSMYRVVKKKMFVVLVNMKKKRKRKIICRVFGISSSRHSIRENGNGNFYCIAFQSNSVVETSGMLNWLQ